VVASAGWLIEHESRSGQATFLHGISFIEGAGGDRLRLMVL
jgi:hypothetical protein